MPSGTRNDQVLKNNTTGSNLPSNIIKIKKKNIEGQLIKKLTDNHVVDKWVMIPV